MDLSRILVDTSVLIDYSKGYGEILGKLLDDQAKGKVQLIVNSVIVAEFMTDKHLKNKRLMEKSARFMELFEIVEMGRKEGYLAGELLRMGACGSLADALIAATCLKQRTYLLTRNVKHFEEVRGLKFYGVEKKRS